MPKEGVRKADNKAKREHRQELENKANKRVAKAEAAAGKLSSSQNKIKDEDRYLLKDFTGVKPKPSKAKGKYSGVTNPPEPPLPLLDLIHNFLEDFKYIKAAHGVRTDNQTRPGHDMELWKWTSEGYPDLIEIFNQWKEQNPTQVKVSQVADKTPKRTQGMALGVFGAGSQQLSKKARKDGSKMAANGASSSHSSSSGSDTDSDSDSSSDSAGGSTSDDSSDIDSESSIADGLIDDPVSVKSVHTADVTLKNLKRKASEMSSSDSSSEDDSKDTSSASDSVESSDSSSGSEAEAPKPNKRRKLDIAAVPVLTATRNSAVEDSSSSSGSDSVSGSDRSSKKQDTAHVGLTNQPNSSGSESESDNDSDASSSSSSSSDSEDGDVPPEAGKLTPSKSAPATNGSDTSATLHYPSDIASAVPAKAPYSTSGSSSDSATERETLAVHTNGEIHPDRMSRMNVIQQQNKPDVLVFKDAKASNPSETQTLPATAHNVSKLKKQAVPFSRIPDNVKVDERFSSNKYIPYDYANKAHEDLVITKGKGFTKEKNKKKRGSYRGGLIDMAPKGIKFDD